MPSFDSFDEDIDYIYKKFKNKNKELVKKDYKMFYHMHPNRRLKKLFFMYPFTPSISGVEANIPFFTISVNKIKKNNKNEFLLIYNNFYEGGIKEVKLNFSDLEDDISIKHNIKELQKVKKMIKYTFDRLTKSIGSVNFYKQ